MQATTHFLPDCKCGGAAHDWCQIKTSANILYWVECERCGKFLPAKKSKAAAVQDWIDWVNGVIRGKDLWTVPY